MNEIHHPAWDRQTQGGRFGSAIVRGLACALAGLCLAGCHTLLPSGDMVMGPSYQPSNFYQASAVLPATVRRVALLPLTSARGEGDAEDGRDALAPILTSELFKTRLFELVAVTPEQMTTLTGKKQWRADEALPPNLTGSLRDHLACDAILFAHLTHFRAYPPLAVGWNLKLVECKENRVLWSVDESFDAGDGAVANAARRYYLEHMRQPGSLEESHSILNSPRRFGQYTLWAVLKTLPPR